MTPSPFTVAAAELLPLGYHPIPLLPPGHDSDGRGKAPGVYRSGRWGHMREWERYRDRAATDFEMRLWTQNWPEANGGILLGSPAGPGLQYALIGVDVDTRDPDEFDAIVRALPHSPMSKKGDKGLTLFFAAPAEIKSRGYKVGPRGKQRTLMDLLTGNQTRQTVVPPSVHPDGPTYVWVSGPVAAVDLPVFTEDDLAVLEETLESLGWGAVEEDDAPQARRELVPRTDDETNVWRDLNDEALARLADWVTELDLYGLKPVRRGGYEAVATWRGSSTGQPLENRKLNLKIHPTGIRDMGDDKTYTALDLVQQVTGWDLDDSFRWLGERLGRAPPLPLPMAPARLVVGMDVGSTPPSSVIRHLNADGVATSIQGMEITQVWVDEARHLQPAVIIDDELPDRMTRPPGLLGALTDYIAYSGRRPSRVMALGAALTIVGTAAGRQFAGPTRTGTHLYVLPLARTSAGKDHPLKMIMRIMHASHLGQHVGPSEFISMPAAIKFIGRSPLAVCPMDEFGSFLKRINSRKASGFEGAISGILRTAWGSSFQPMTTPEWAHVESRTIFGPCLSLYGASTPEEFYGSLASADTSNGLMNRFLVLSTKKKAPEQDPTEDPAIVPDVIIEQIRNLYYARGELFAASLNQADQDRAPAIVLWADDAAKQVYVDFGRVIEARSDLDNLEANFLGRTVEMAQRIATLCALGRAGATARVTSEDMAWGRDVALWSAETMIAGAREHMSENDHQQAMKLVLNLIRDAGQITRNELVRRVYGRLDGRSLDGILKGLVEGEMVWEAQQQAGKAGGRPKRVYVHGEPPGALT